MRKKQNNQMTNVLGCLLAMAVIGGAWLVFALTQFVINYYKNGQ